MGLLTDILGPIVVMGVLGGFIDFLVGKKGQDKVRDFMLRWWVRFDDVRWHNFGKEEAIFAGQIMDKWFGKKIWSWRRVLSTIVISVTVLIIVVILPVDSRESSALGRRDVFVGYFIIAALGIAASLSVLRLITVAVISTMSRNQYINFGLFLSFLVLNYAFMMIWASVADTIRWHALLTVSNDGIWDLLRYQFLVTLITIIPGGIIGGFKDIIHVPAPLQTINDNMNNVMWFSDFYLNDYYSCVLGVSGMILTYVPGIVRFVLLFVFTFSFLCGPFIRRPTLFLWARVIEASETKPIFAMIFGGAATLATAISRS